MSGLGVVPQWELIGLIAPGQRTILLLLLEIYNAITLDANSVAVTPVQPTQELETILVSQPEKLRVPDQKARWVSVVTIIGLVLTAIGSLAAVIVVPEARVFIGLDKPPSRIHSPSYANSIKSGKPYPVLIVVDTVESNREEVAAIFQTQLTAQGFHLVENGDGIVPEMVLHIVGQSPDCGIALDYYACRVSLAVQGLAGDNKNPVFSLPPKKESSGPQDSYGAALRAAYKNTAEALAAQVAVRLRKL